MVLYRRSLQRSLPIFGSLKAQFWEEMEERETWA